MFGKILDIIFTFCIEQATSSTINELQNTDLGRTFLMRLRLHKLPDENDFEGFYKYSFLEYALGREDSDKQKTILYLFQDKGVQKAFQKSFETGNDIAISDCIDAVYEADETIDIFNKFPKEDARHEVALFRQIFTRIVRSSRPMHAIQDQHARDEQYSTVMQELAEIKSMLSEQQPKLSDAESEVSENIPKTPQANYYQQLAYIENQLVNNPSNIQLLAEKARLHYQYHDMDKALGTINLTWELDQQSIEVMNLRACIITDYAGEIKTLPKSMLLEAIKLFEVVSNHATGNTSGIDYNIGNAYQYMEEHDKAIARYQVALSKKPDDDLASEIYTNMGNTYVVKDEYDLAVEAFKSALERNSLRWQAVSSWGEVELTRGNHQLASQLFNRLLQVHPQISQTSASHCYALSFALWHIDEYETAYYWVNQALYIRPSYSNAKLLKAYLLANLWEDSDRYIYSAISFFESMRIDEPDNTFAGHILHLIYTSEGYLDKAKMIIEATPSPDEVPPFVCYDYAMFLKDEGKLHEAIIWLESANRRETAHHFAHQLANLKYKTGAYEDAIKYYRIAMQEAHHKLDILQNVATCYVYLKNYQMAIVLMTKAIRYEPTNANWWNNVTYALKEMGKYRLMPSQSLIKALETGTQLDVAAEIQPHIDTLVDNLSSEFGQEFVDKILASEWIPE